MATTYKNLSRQDVSNVKTRLHEAIPITGSIVSGTYAETNIKTYAHGMFQSVYDYPYLSSSANHIFDITVGASTSWPSSSLVTEQKQKKSNIYNQMAQILAGYDETGSIRLIDRDGVFSTTGVTDVTKHTSLVYLNFARLLNKDEIQKESFSIEFAASSGYTQPAKNSIRIKLFDSGALSNYRINSPAGEYGILYLTNSAGSPVSGTTYQAGGASAVQAGLIFYQAGVVAINPYVFMANAETGSIGPLSASMQLNSAGNTISQLLTGSTIDQIATGIRNRIYNISFNNTTELNSTIYFCRVNSGEFNYSSNPTYLSGSKIVVKNNATDVPVSYFTTVGLYSSDNELLAVAKLSEPLRKDPSIEHTIRVRLDY